MTTITIETALPDPYVRGPRYIVKVDGRKAYLTYAGFRLLLILKSQNRWLSIDDLAQHNTRFYIWHLCRDLGLDTQTFILNNRTKQYRLNTDRVEVVITAQAFAQLRKCDDAIIRSLTFMKPHRNHPTLIQQVI